MAINSNRPIAVSWQAEERRIIGNIDLYHTHQRQRLETIRRLRFGATF